MSQPEKQPDTGRGAAGDRRDLVGGPFPLGDWSAPAEQLDTLYRRVEQDALRTIDWYLADRVRKRRAARLLRTGAALGAATGGALPLLHLAGVAPLAGWGYLALLGAALCLGADRYFGLTTGWMRDMATAQAVQRHLEELRYAWAAESVQDRLGSADSTTGEAAERCLALLRRFSARTQELVRSETADWMVEFRCGGALPLHAPVDPPCANGEPVGPPQPPQPRRLPPAGAVRPIMPRQRPPEGPPY